ncbi:type VI secretion system baseplate subunit TssK [Shinella sp. JR1-6]|uniref:type VI secretion system baseplate subunit TssK n=1 Tax=Shinella sp. JR1-6 TaxID=2527671 RepID=UPI00102D5880|nr:type VI secretion system baseplate subunit TssK [Shinella sp. JR1-6]TAA60118.1 type VI secretion system baseplate subunit TssK [Shinella sp. JR1-6]
MSFDDKVIWSEGMFIRAQHFQQEARHVERQLRARTKALVPYGWGLTELRVNRELLSIGQFAVERAAGVFPDGTPFSLPDGGVRLPPLMLGESVRNAVIYLTLPLTEPGGREVADADAELTTRYTLAEVDVADANSSDLSAAPINVGKLRLRYGLETSDRSGLVGIGLARIVEVRSDNSVVLDESYVPPAMDCSVSPILSGLLTEIVGLTNHRGEAIASRLAGTNVGTAAEITDLMMLQTINRWQPVFTHMASAAFVHPERLFVAMIGLAGELATFTAAGHRPRPFPVYDHERLQLSFAPVAAAVRQALNAVLERSAITIPLIEHRYGIRVADVPDRSIYGKYSFILAAKADMPADALVRRLVGQIKIGAAEQITELVNAALPGVMLRALPVAPRQIPYHTGKAYFELDRSSPNWKQIAAGTGLAIHVAGDFPALELDLWAVKD